MVKIPAWRRSKLSYWIKLTTMADRARKLMQTVRYTVDVAGALGDSGTTMQKAALETYIRRLSQSTT